jgi:hypothetical protein
VSSFQCVSTFQRLILNFLPCFTQPSGESFLALTTAWALAVGPRTVTNLVRTMGRSASKSHDAYQYFFSGAVWAMDEVWRILFDLILASRLIDRDAVIELAGDDTLVHHTGRRIFGAGIFRDAVRSTKKQVAYAFGHNWVILCVIVPVPFCPNVFVSLPVCARLRPKPPKIKGRRKQKAGVTKTTVELLAEMAALVASWAPERRFRLVGDGAYASLAADLPSNMTLISRLRKDAALYAPPPIRRRKKPGRPRRKGKRLPTPAQRAKSSRLSWKKTPLVLYGVRVVRLLHSYQAYWYEVCPDAPIQIVIVRDPDGKHDDEFFFSTDLTLSSKAIVEGYGHRWSQEVTHREAKQQMGIDDPQARLQPAVERQAPFCLLILSLVKLWYLTAGHRSDELLTWRDAWYRHKEGVSFTDMLAALRFGSWRLWFSRGSGLAPQHSKILRPLLRALARA